VAWNIRNYRYVGDVSICDTNNNIVKVKLFPYSLGGKALDWVLKWPPRNFRSWFNFKAPSVGIFGCSEIVSHLRENIIYFKKTIYELLVRALERFWVLAYGTEHRQIDWVLMFIFYSGITNTYKKYLDKECGAHP
jgi:hypothetical protein